jgi:hypothetical protein
MKIKVKLLVILLVLITLFSVGCFKSQVIAVSSNRLYADYRADATAADQIYKDKTLQVTGIISSLGVDTTGSPYILFENICDFGFCGVQCILSSSYASYFTSLAAGQTATIEGKCQGYYSSVVLIVVH